MNPYELLEVSHSASAAVIRRQYRRMAQKWHPDRNLDNQLESERRFKQIAEAYRILSDPKERHLWDLRHSFAGRRTRTLWDRLREETDNPKSQVLTILYDLANGQVEEGFLRWEKLKKQGHGEPEKLLKGRDYRDCLFLLAEQFVKRGFEEEAIEMYHRVYWEEHRAPLMPYYKEETRERLLALLSDFKCSDPRKHLKYIARGLSYAHTKPLRRKLLTALSNTAMKLGNHELAHKAARGVGIQGGNVSKLLVNKSFKRV